MGIEYADEKFSKASRALALEPGRIKERLEQALIPHLILLSEEHLTEDLRPFFKQLIERVTKNDPVLEGEAPVDATLREMSEDEAVEIAGEIIALAREVEAAWKSEGER